MTGGPNHGEAANVTLETVVVATTTLKQYRRRDRREQLHVDSGGMPCDARRKDITAIDAPSHDDHCPSKRQSAAHEKKGLEVVQPRVDVPAASTDVRDPAGRHAYELLEFWSLPEHLKDNEFIHRHYRGEWPVREALYSLFRIHNETGNIWTHLIGFMLFVALTIYTAIELPMVVDFHHLPAFHLPHSLANASGAIPHHVPDVAHLRDSSWHVELPRLTAIYNRLSHMELPHLPASFYEAMPHMPHMPAMPHIPNLHEVQELIHSQEALLLKILQSHLPHVELPSLDSARARVLWYYAYLLHAHALHTQSQCPTVPSLDKIPGTTHKDDGVCGLDDKPWPLVRLLHSVTRPAPTARWPFFLFLAGAMLCLFASTTCHLLGCQNRAVSQLIWRFDYAGIAALICASFYPAIYYCYLCMPVVRNTYLVAVTIIGAFTVMVSLMSSFQGTEYRAFRASLFFCMGFSGIIPCTHSMFLFHDEPQVMKSTMLELLMGVFYGLGALVYATRIPERWMPGRFDIAGHSHQIFHLLVIAGAYTHYKAATIIMEWRDMHPCV